MKLNDIIKKIQPFINNKYVNTYLYIFLILYASLAAPKLPHVFVQLFDYSIFRMFVIFGIGYLSSKDVTAALLATIGIAITMYTLNLHKTNDALKNVSENINEDIENFIENFKPMENNTYEPNYQNCQTCKQNSYAEHYEPNYDVNMYQNVNTEDHIEHFEQDLND